MSAVTKDAREPVTIVGAGLAGTLLATLLARRGHPVRIFERMPDMRSSTIPAGRSINLALAARGIRALELAGVMDRVRPLLIPMPGRMLHAIDGALTFAPYGQGEHEVIYCRRRGYSPSQPGAARRGVGTTRRMSAATGDRGRWRRLGGSTCVGERA
jgi:2-polyprenyl-6-methoxyphenol hydroxylase-like FAD-dependent oxidoreductase